MASISLFTKLARTTSRSSTLPTTSTHLHLQPTLSSFFSTHHRHHAPLAQPPSYLNPAEQHIFTLLQQSALAPTRLEVQDISGGCGSMYGIEVVSAAFAGLSTIKQHRLVNGVLGDEIKKWHGVQLKTKAAEQEE